MQDKVIEIAKFQWQLLPNCSGRSVQLVQIDASRALMKKGTWLIFAPGRGVGGGRGCRSSVSREGAVQESYRVRLTVSASEGRIESVDYC